MKVYIAPVVTAIHDEMKRREMTVVELAEAADITFQQLYRIFAGESAPNLDTVNRLLAALDLKMVVGR